MLHILPQERFATASVSHGITTEPMMATDMGMNTPSVEDLRRNQALDQSADYEIVLGRRQVASVSFVVLVLIAMFAGIAYLAGRMAVARAGQTGAQAVQTPIARPTPLAPSAADMQNQPAEVANTEVSANGVVRADLFTDPIAGALYLQTAAVDRGVATIMAEGIRTHGLRSLVAPGPNDRIFRVLVGPFPNMQAYRDAQGLLAQLGMTAFAQFQR